ncbi:MAG: SDR family oxidoreductase [Alphaproteobacteria bacterium]|nr:SDR family oxidoreductase [Alphaproteobacteria bacterium]
MLAGRHAVVTGAAGGIGAAVIRAFEQAGARCHGMDLEGSGALLACDVTDEASVERAFAAAEKAGAIHDVVHAAGVVFVGSVAATSIAEVRRIIDINLVGSFVVGRVAARCLRPGGTITFLASQAGVKGSPNWSAYCASKAGVLRLTESLAHELGPRSIRVNALCPGGVDTPMLDEAIDQKAAIEGTSSDAVRAAYAQGVPLRRLARAEEIASVCVFLASEQASYVNGTGIMIDGGELA